MKLATQRATCNRPVAGGRKCSRKPGHRGPHLPQGVTLRPKSRLKAAGLNAGQGQYFRFHGAFISKDDAVRKEKTTPGSFMHKRYIPGWEKARYIVMTPQKNPKRGRFSVTKIGTQEAIFKALQREARQERAAEAKQAKSGHRESAQMRLFRNRKSRKNLWVRTTDGRVGRVVKMRGPQSWTLAVPGTKGLVSYEGRAETTSAPTKNPGHELVLLGLGNPKRKAAKKSIHRRAKKSLHRHRRNSELSQARQLFRRFHGKDFSGVVSMQRSAKARSEYTALGPLVAIGIDAPTFDEAGPPTPDEVVDRWERLPHLRFPKGALLGSSPDGKQIYVLGGDQEVDLSRFDTDSGKDYVDLGDATFIVYDARKAPSFEVTSWVHTFGEEGGERPRLIYDKLNREIHFAGGSYKVKAPGIVN